MNTNELKNSAAVLIETVRIANGADTPMIEAVLKDGREAAEYVENGEVLISGDSHLDTQIGFTPSEVWAIHTELKARGTVIVLVNNHSGYVWSQGETVEAAQAEADREADPRDVGEWVEADHQAADYTAYEVPALEYNAEDGSFVREAGYRVSSWNQAERAAA